jgi:sphingomyelin phosphodiesterase
MLTYIRDTIAPDFLIWTGDNSRSNTWANTQQEVIDYVNNITGTMKEMGIDKVMTIYPIEGNHDTYPVNVEDFSAPGIDVSTNGFKAGWEAWLDPEQYEIYG